MWLVPEISVKQHVDFGGDCFDWFDLGVLVTFRFVYIIESYLNEIMWFNTKLFYSGVSDESHKEDTSAVELKMTDETIETTEASMYLYSFKYSYMMK